jgi:hypothetical protein
VNCLKFTKIVPGPLRQIGITNAINNIKGNVIPSIPQVKKKLYSGIIGISKANWRSVSKGSKNHQVSTHIRKKPIEPIKASIRIFDSSSSGTREIRTVNTINVPIITSRIGGSGKGVDGSKGKDIGGSKGTVYNKVPKLLDVVFISISLFFKRTPFMIVFKMVFNERTYCLRKKLFCFINFSLILIKRTLTTSSVDCDK